MIFIQRANSRYYVYRQDGKEQTCLNKFFTFNKADAYASQYKNYEPSWNNIR